MSPMRAICSGAGFEEGLRHGLAGVAVEDVEVILLGGESVATEDAVTLDDEILDIRDERCAAPEELAGCEVDRGEIGVHAHGALRVGVVRVGNVKDSVDDAGETGRLINVVFIACHHLGGHCGRD
jgi:hypothetical protein